MSITPETVANTESSAEHLELERVLTSHSFAKSPRLCSLLGFIVTHSLRGSHVDLTEQQIGIQVFGRTPGYNSSEDTIVRVTVRQLRQRLDIYYSSEGAGNKFRIDIPKGGYIATVERRIGPNASAASAAAMPPIASPDSFSVPLVPPVVPRERLRYRVATVLLSIVVLVLAVVCIQQRRASVVPPVQKGPLPLWKALFTPDRKTLIVPGDAALDMFTVWEQRSLSLEQYATHNYDRDSKASVPPTHTDVPLSIRSVTPMADLVLVANLVKVPEHMGMPELDRNIEVRYARDVAVADTHDNNLILIGSETFNPWVMLYQPEMDFVAHYDYVADVYSVQNKSPKQGEEVSYIYRRTRPVLKAITHIALLNNSQGQGRVLIVEGTSMGTTYGALNFLTSDWLYGPVLRQATDSSGRLHDFEVLLSGDFIHGGVGNTKVIALHVH
ncbi:hypothetical protein [Terriglobus sp. RCC_193]|uniref:hypothetical protein n=1 Tax=Terriglobus sp. RCC_193 TaxID=3239218 RepID=UPI003525EB9C